MYTATDPFTALGETFQSTRLIDRQHNDPMLVAWQPTRTLLLLDLTGYWPVVNGTSASIQMGTKRYTQAWAREIDGQLGFRIDGLWQLSALTGQRIATLFSRVEQIPTIPTRPSFHVALRSRAAESVVLPAAIKLGYSVL